MCVEATVSGYPPPEVTWLNNDEELVNNEDVKIQKDKDKYKMVITKAAFRHSGSYTIRAANEGGQDQKDFKISVLSKKQNTSFISLASNSGCKIVIAYSVVTY